MKYLAFISILLCSGAFGQRTMASLPKELSETSALLYIDDEFYTINDSGNKAVIYIFNEKGEIIHSSQVLNSENYDWEALTYDGENIYIGDIGNNNNDRRNLRVYVVVKDSVRKNETVQANEIRFYYEGQRSFPPIEEKRYFDAEALIYKNDSLFIFTKNRTAPFDGISRVYHVPTDITTKVEAQYLYDLKLNPTNWMEESITDAYSCEEYLFVLTYAKIYSFKWKGSNFVLDKRYDFNGYTQKEGLSLDKKFFYMTDEDESIITGGNKLYKLRR